VKANLLEYLYTLEEHYPTVKILAVNTDEDHIHLQIEIPPDIAVAKVVQLLKQNSSRNIRKNYAFIRRMYLEDSIWSVGYFSSTIGLNEEQIRKYIAHQGEKELPQEVSFESV
jgi:putative transposase